MVPQHFISFSIACAEGVPAQASCCGNKHSTENRTGREKKNKTRGASRPWLLPVPPCEPGGGGTSNPPSWASCQVAAPSPAGRCAGPRPVPPITLRHPLQGEDSCRPLFSARAAVREKIRRTPFPEGFWELHRHPGEPRGSSQLLT